MAHFKLSRLGNSTQPANVSFEFFPPVSDAAEAQLWKAVRRLETLKPHFVSVTYGAGGTTRERTQRTLKRIVEETSLDVAAHLTCIGAAREEIDAIVREFSSLGINRFVALRGDPPAGAGECYVPTEGGYANGAELCAGLKAISDFDITVSAYPEKHPESPDFSTDLIC